MFLDARRPATGRETSTKGPPGLSILRMDPNTANREASAKVWRDLQAKYARAKPHQANQRPTLLKKAAPTHVQVPKPRAPYELNDEIALSPDPYNSFELQLRNSAETHFPVPAITGHRHIPHRNPPGETLIVVDSNLTPDQTRPATTDHEPSRLGQNQRVREHHCLSIFVIHQQTPKPSRGNLRDHRVLFTLDTNASHTESERRFINCFINRFTRTKQLTLSNVFNARYMCIVDIHMREAITRISHCLPHFISNADANARPETAPETGTHFTSWYETNLDQRYNKSNNKIIKNLTTRNSLRVFHLINITHLSPTLPPKLKLERHTNGTFRSETNPDHHNSNTFRHNNRPTLSEFENSHSQNLAWCKKTHLQAPSGALTNGTFRSETNPDQHNSNTFRYNNRPTLSEFDNSHSQNLAWCKKTHLQAPYGALKHHCQYEN
jgi:hypothetical protein